MLVELRQFIFNILSESEALNGIPVILDQVRAKAGDKDKRTTDTKIEDALAEKGFCISVHMGSISPIPEKTSAAFFTCEYTVPVTIEENGHVSTFSNNINIEWLYEEIYKTLLRALVSDKRPEGFTPVIPAVTSVPISEWENTGIFSTTLFFTCIGRILLTK